MKRIEFESDDVDRDGGDGEKFIHLAPVGEYLEFAAANIRKTAKNLTKAAANIEDALPFLGHFIDENERALRNIEKLKGLQELIFELSERVEKLEKATQRQQSQILATRLEKLRRHAQKRKSQPKESKGLKQ